MAKLVIHVEGGLVQGIYSDSSFPLEIAVMDMDMKNVEDDEILELNDGRKFSGYKEISAFKPALVNEVFNQV